MAFGNRGSMDATDPAQPPFIPFASRRSVVHSTNGIVSCVQPLAAQAGLRILREGGNAADAAVAVAACLNVTEPTSTGIGGDLFCLFYNAKDKTIKGLNASGRAPAALNRDKIINDLKLKADPNNEQLLVDAAGKPVGRIPMDSVHAVTVPGSAGGWCDAVEQFGSGKMKMEEILKDAVRLCEEGFPVSELSARFWKECEGTLKGENKGELLKNGERPPRVGEIMKKPGLAKVFKELAKKGKKGFYEGWVAEAIVEAIKKNGGVMELEDLKEFGQTAADMPTPISKEWEGHRVWECAPNGQGLVALMALGILENIEKNTGKKIGIDEGWKHNQTEYLHAVIEALRIAFSDGHWWIADPAVNPAPVDGLLSSEYLYKRSHLFSMDSVNTGLQHGTPAWQSTDTVYFSVTDKDGNGCSFINSTFGGFGSGIIPSGCGFVLQNRGSGFSLRQDHPNVLAPKKRPYHTIIPGMLTDPTGKDLKAVFGCMGGFMQPQGHVQLLLNALKCGMDPQAALDSPRISIGTNYDPGAAIVHIEEGVPEETLKGLREKGHVIKEVKGYERGLFGRGQIIVKTVDEGQQVWSAGSDLRGDGQAVGY
ncbi:nucleophile aminohydrolase [Pyronema domesticum]|uniref:Similar to Putative gamma-glutamyltransferase ywrD acc. no. O05218 n=1 Tax=Pyronema omphalodes (strain CBS 100304) TaxID=1076935 RepID=U4L478_PYROM|nr:nucleophile aminohydrolase [Pyronema domesticum]CCX07093.1 Similar to Putative gamma-glutamyltransferase ywrD; acc. no. O05218 [Pyronema omphalodes CBS 100304]